MGVAVVGLLVAGQAPIANAATTAERSCAEGLPATAVCGTLTVPESRTVGGGRTIDLPYTIIPASTQPATGTPIVTMAGGPGQVTSRVAETLAADPRIGASRDVVVLSQRGGADTSTSLDCPGATSAYVDTFTTDTSPAGEMSAVGLALKNCLADFASGGGDATAYTKTDTALDVIDLRQTLGYLSWTLYGDSWSTKVMQIAANRDPQGVDAVVLDAFTPVDRNIKGDAYQALYDTLGVVSARSEGAYPDLNADLATATDLFNDKPGHGLLTNPVTGQQRYYSLTGSDVVTIVQQALYDPATAPAVPFLLHQLAAGKMDAISTFIPDALKHLTDTSLGQYWVEMCRDEKPYWSPDPVLPTPEGSDVSVPTPLPVLTYFTAADELCDVAGIPASSPDTRQFQPQGMPALIFASDTDPLIPLAAVQSGGPAFPNNQLVTMQSAGRGGVVSDPCALDQLATWLAAPGAGVQAVCSDLTSTYPVPAPDQVHPSSRFSSVVSAVDDRNLFELTIPLIFGAFVVLWLVGWLIAVLVQVLRREPFGLLIASGIAPVTGAVFLLVAWLMVSATLAQYPGFTLVGVPPMLPWVGILLGVGFLGLIPVWRLGNRPAAALAAAATLVWLAMIVWFVWIAVLPS